MAEKTTRVISLAGNYFKTVQDPSLGLAMVLEGAHKMDDEELRLFGEGGLFGKSASAEDRPPTDDWDEHEDESFFVSKQQGFEYEEGKYEGQSWAETTAATQAQPTVEEYIPGYPMQSEEGWSAAIYEERVPTKGRVEVGSARQYDWMSPKKKGPSYIGRWEPNGSLLKFQPEPTQEFDPYPPVGKHSKEKVHFIRRLSEEGVSGMRHMHFMGLSMWEFLVCALEADERVFREVVSAFVCLGHNVH